ncbi:MAG: hypothetical protein AAGJ17_00090 [Pseudomonadota bacterium]
MSNNLVEKLKLFIKKANEDISELENPYIKQLEKAYVPKSERCSHQISCGSCFKVNTFYGYQMSTDEILKKDCQYCGCNFETEKKPHYRYNWKTQKAERVK